MVILISMAVGRSNVYVVLQKKWCSKQSIVQETYCVVKLQFVMYLIIQLEMAGQVYHG